MDRFDCPPRFESNNYLPLNGELNSSLNFTSDSPLTSFNYNPYLNFYNSGTNLNTPPKNKFENVGNSSTYPSLSKAAKKRFNRLLREGVPPDEAKILAQNPGCMGPSTSNPQQETTLFQNPKHISNGSGPFDDFQDYVQFRMENAGLIPRDTQNPRRMSLNSLFSKPYYKPIKKKRKKPKNFSNLDKFLLNKNQKSEVQIKTAAEKRRAKNARRKLRLKELKNRQMNENTPVIEKNKIATPAVEKQIPQTNVNVKTVVQNSPEVKKKEIITEISLGIVPVDYPQTSFSQEQLNAIQKDILAKVALQKTETVKPRFKGVKMENGLMVVQCADEQSAFWLKSIEYSLSLQTQIKLKIVDKIPKILTAIGYFPDSAEDSNEFILELISGQNQDLNVDEWKVVDRKEEEGNSVLTILVGEVFAEKIKSNEPINYKFGFAKFVLDLPKATSLEQSTPKSDLVLD